MAGKDVILERDKTSNRASFAVSIDERAHQAPPKLTRILFVEDERDIQMVARLALEDIGGFTVEACSSGSEALERAPCFGPDLILLDVMMPAPDGPATLSALSEMPATAQTPVVFVTAKVQNHEVAHYLELGAIDVIVKPFDPMTLADRVLEIWHRHHDP